MPKEYRTIQEVAGPLMLIHDVTDVTYNELGEIELANGENAAAAGFWRSTATDALVQLFENSAGINLSNSKVRFLGHGIELGVSEDMLGRVFDGLGHPKDGKVGYHSGQAAGCKRRAYEPGSAELSGGVYPDRNSAPLTV